MILEFKDLKKSYGDKEILHGLNFKVEGGRAMAFLGRNGAGKTTTIRALMGVFNQDSGEILLDGKKIDRQKVSFGYLPEERGLYGKDKILRQLSYFGSLRNSSWQESRSSAMELLEKVGLYDHKDDKLETLSKGNQQKVQIVEALLNEPDIIVLDEPFSGLDPVNSRLLMNLINEFVEAGKIVLFSSHQMSYVEDICQDLTLIDQGNVILTGDLDDIKTRLGRGKVRIKARNLGLDELEDRISDIDNLDIDRDAKSLIVDISNLERDDFIKMLIDRDVDIDLFSSYKPSVEDIFVNYLGELEDEEHI